MRPSGNNLWMRATAGKGGAIVIRLAHKDWLVLTQTRPDGKQQV